ncbi:hypothetical protein DDE82_003249 [Stemphylium lycopersici]|uniref:Rhodopsin domain-containing protein n=1 Tax=Stemphylium lycopersici TaxID=183478 RepID=A0A364N4L3_STELY|nr:hypothetical protein DDE82_003249 [Stemphylium lycopersici]RAR11428.1 hypothetical protein DDE83_004574 [Stemphylium lycopersici]
MAASDGTPSVRHVGHGRGLKFAIGLCLCYTLCMACLRGYIRWGAYGIDDAFVLLSGVLALGFFGSTFQAISVGLGRPMDELNLHQPFIDKLNSYTLAGNIVWITALCISKIAIVAMLLRTTQTLAHRRVQYGAGGLIAAQCLVSVVLLIANCNARHELLWDTTSTAPGCPQKETRWQVLTALDLATEVSLLVLPVQLVWSLQMSSRNKLIVISAFWLRIPTIIFSALRQSETHKLTSASDVSIAATRIVIWQAVELSYSLAAATIAALKRFTESLNTGFGHGELMRIHGSSQGYEMSTRSAKSEKRFPHTKAARFKGLAQDLDTVSSGASTVGASSEPHITRMKLRPEPVRNTATVSSPRKDPVAENRPLDTKRLKDNIIQEVEYSVQYEQGPKHP